MSEEDILKLVSEHIFFDAQADDPDILMNQYGHAVSKDKFIAFARAIEAKAAVKEREACELACENEKTRFANRQNNTKDFDLCIAAIRTRGENV